MSHSISLTHRSYHAAFTVSIVVIVATLWGGTVAAEDSLGRLFTTEAERAQLDKQRALHKPGKEGEDTEDREEWVVKGYVLRDDGHNAVWFNGESTLQSLPQDVYIGTDNTTRNSQSVHLRIEGKTVRVKPGQKYSVVDGETKELYYEQPDSGHEKNGVTILEEMPDVSTILQVGG